MLNLLSKVVIALGAVNAAYLNAASPMIWATPSGQPAGQASAPSLFHVSAKGDHQAQGGDQ